MSIQGQLNKQALDMLPATSQYIEEVDDPTWAANLRGMAIQAILNTSPALDRKSGDELDEFDRDIRNWFYKMSNDERFDSDLFERDLHK